MRLWHHFLLFWVVVCPHFWSMYGFHCIPPFSKSFIYVNTRIIKIHGFNSNESASFSSLQALLTTQLLSHIWKEQKDFRGKILSPWPLEDFAIGGTWFNDTQNFAVTIDYLETETIFINGTEFVTWNICLYNQWFFFLYSKPSIDQGFTW